MAGKNPSPHTDRGTGEAATPQLKLSRDLVLAILKKMSFDHWTIIPNSNSWKAKDNLKTRTTRTPALWATPRCPKLVIHIRSQVKTRQSQNYKFKKIAKNTNFKILPVTLHVTHLLELLDNMYKYEMDPTKTVGATERTRDAGRTEWNQYIPPPNNFAVRGGGGIITFLSGQHYACWWPSTVRS